jgi:MFS family permease
MRRNLPETLQPAPNHATAARARVPARVAVLGVMMLGAALICAYGLNYLTTYAQDSLHMPAKLAFGATVVLGLTLMLSDVFAGVLSDRFGRKPVMLSAVALLVLLVVPGFMVMVHRPSAACVYAVTALLAVGEALATGPALITITELLPASVRSAGLGAIYAVAATVLGGSTQFMIKLLGDVTGSKLAPAWYLTAALVIGAVAMLLVRETAPIKTRSKTGPAAAPGEVGRL